MYLYDASYVGIRRALTNLYRMSGKDMDQEFKKELSQCISVMNRVIYSNKNKSIISLKEGKRAMILISTKHYAVHYIREKTKIFFLHMHF